jgi:hypothetical protein
MQRNYNAIVVEVERELPSAWVDADDVTIPGFGEDLPRAALEAARSSGFGVSTAGRKACVYIAGAQGSSGWPSSAEVEAFCPRALEIVAALGRA